MESAGLLHDALVRACLGPPCGACGAPAALTHARVNAHCDACGAATAAVLEPEPEPEPPGQERSAPPTAVMAGLSWPAPYAAYEPRRCGCPLTLLLPPCPPASTLVQQRPADAAAVAAIARGYRALSELGCHPDVILLLSESAQCGVNEAEKWVTPLGTVWGDPTTAHALLEGSRQLARLPPASTEGGAAAHAPWVWSLAPTYDCERRDGLVATRLVPIGVPADLEPHAVEGLATLLASTIGEAASTRRFAVIGTTAPVPGGAGSGVERGDRGAAAVAELCAKLMGHRPASNLGPMAFCCRALPPLALPARRGADHRGEEKLLFRWEAGAGTAAGTWVCAGPWAESHGPHACSDWRGSWGNSAQIHMHASDLQHPECLHAVWTPPVDDASTKGQTARGAVICVTGAGAGAGPHGSFGPFCLFSTLAAELPHTGVGVMTLVYPNWAVGKQSVAVLAVREAAALLSALQPDAGVVLLGWSLGGAASIEAAGRLLTSGEKLPRVRGVITLASQAAGLLKVGNGRGRINSVRFALRVLGEANVPLLCMHGTADECVRPNQTDLIAEWWACKPCVVKKPLVGDDHGVAAALPHVLDSVATMLL
jgi:hypothetical protein